MKLKLSRRETILGCSTLSAIIIGLTFWIGEPKINSWKQLSGEKENLREQIEQNQQIISRQDSFTKQLTELQQKIPRFESKRRVTPELLKDIKTLADKRKLKLPRIQPGKEKQIGDLFELHITCSWEGSLEAVTQFLFDLQSAGSRYDIAQMHVTPLATDKLKGSMEIACAYYRKNGPADLIK